jgi:hypothetical protein
VAREETDFDVGVVGVLVAALAVVLVACVCGADWVRPPYEGEGPWVTPERLHTLKIAAVAAGVVVLLCVARAIWVRSGTPMWAATAAIGIVAVLGLALVLQPSPARLTASGFDSERYRAATGTDLMFYNTTGAAVTVCLGISGDCDSAAKGPQRLRSPGLVIPANHRLQVPVPDRTGEFRLTIAGAGAGLTRRDAILETYHQDSAV